MRKGHLIWILSVALLNGIAQHASAQWEMIGPDGSPDDIVKIDSLLYGTTMYGYYRSSDEGQSWTRVEKGLHKRYGHHIELHYDGVDLYLPAASFSEGDVDRGFYILDRQSGEWKYEDSTNDKLYTEQTTRISADTFFSIIPNPFLSNTDGFDTLPTLYLTTDKGATWVKRSPPDSVIVEHFQYINQRIFAATYKEKAPHVITVFQSDDHGVSWTKNEFPGQGYFQFFGPFPEYLIGRFSSNPFFYRSTDRGNTWIELAQGIGKNPVAAVTIDTFDLLAFTNTPMVVSYDQGRNWKLFTTANGEFIYRIVKNTTGDGYLALVSNVEYGSDRLCQLDKSLRIVRTAENAGFKTTAHWIAHATDSLLVILGEFDQYDAFDSILISTDRGETWNIRTITVPGLGLYRSPWVQGDTYVFGLAFSAPGQYSFVRSSDQGLHWDDISPELPIKNLPYILAVTNDTIVVRYTDNASEHQYRMSTDGGTTWRVVQTLAPWILGSCFHSGYFYGMHNTITNYQLYRTANGFVWEEVNTPRDNNASIEFIGSFFNLDGVFFITGKGYNSSLKRDTSYLFRSTDAGITWTDINEQIGIIGWTIHMVHKDSMMYLVSMGDLFGGPPEGHPKLYASSDRGATWKPFDNSIPEADRFGVTNSDLFASSFYGGIYRWANPTVNVRKHITQTQTLSIFPNPANTSVTVSHSIFEPGHYRYSIVGISGNILSTRTKFIGETGEAVFDLSVAEFPSGIYCVRIRGAGTVQQTLFTVLR